MWYAAAYLGLVAVTSLASFAAYGLDKRRAAVGGRRVPERTLHLLASLGGWPGAILAQRQFRHKTRKVSFQIAFGPSSCCTSPSSGLWRTPSSARSGLEASNVPGR